MSKHRFVFLLVCTLLVPAVGRAQERLFAAAGGALHEVSLSPQQLGTVLRSWPLPLPVHSQYPSELITFGRGQKLGWTSITDGMLYLSVFDVASAIFSRFPIAPSRFPIHAPLVGVADARESLLFMVTDENGERAVLDWHVPTRRIVQSATLRGGCHFDYAYASEAHVLFARRGSRCGLVGPDAQWIDVVDLKTGSVRERAFDVPYGFAQRIATNSNGTRLWVSTAQSGFAAPASIGVFDTRTGQLLNVNLNVDPEDRQYPTFVRYVDPGVVLLVTSDGLTGVHADTLQPIATADAPRFRLHSSEIPPGYDPYFGYDVKIHPASRVIVAYEYAGITYSYHGGPCLQSAIVLLNPQNGDRLATRDLDDVAGGPVCGAQFALAVPTP